MQSSGKNIPKTTSKADSFQQRKWIWRKPSKNAKATAGKVFKSKITKRQLVDVMITKGPLDDFVNGDKKRKQLMEGSEAQNNKPEVVLAGQHHLPQ